VRPSLPAALTTLSRKSGADVSAGPSPPVPGTLSPISEGFRGTFRGAGTWHNSDAPRGLSPRGPIAPLGAQGLISPKPLMLL
jgi:hypothetical protein